MIFFTVVLSEFFSSACLYLVLHAILIMVQATTLNVAFNSHNKSLLTIMMSNNVSAHTYTHADKHLYATQDIVVHNNLPDVICLSSYTLAQTKYIHTRYLS